PKKESAEDPRVTLQEAIMRRRLEKYPGDFPAHYNLGALEMTRGKYREAAPHFQKAVSARPASASARNGLAGAFMGQGRYENAIPQLQEALRIDPVHGNARLNLAKALMHEGDLAGAASELDAFLKQKPGHADAQFALGTVYFMQHRYEQALLHLQQAARLKPEDAEIGAWPPRARDALPNKP